MKLNRILCNSSNLQYGECNSSSFEAQITNISDLSGVKIYVYQKIETEIVPLFTGVIDSCKAVRNKSYRKLVAYDELYSISSKNVVNWYNGLFENSNSYTMKQFRDSFFTYLGIEQEFIELLNDDITIEKTIQTDSLKAGDVMYAICQINACFGHITPEGKFKYVYLDAGATFDVSDNLRNTTSYEEYVTKPIEKLMVLSDEDELNVSVGSGDNTYTIKGNFLIYGYDTETLRTVATRIYQKIKDVSYRPADIKTVLSEINIQLGDSVTVTDSNTSFNTYVLKERFSGTQLLTQVIETDGEEEYADVINDVNGDIKELKLKQSTIVLALQTEYLKAETAELEYIKNSQLTTIEADIKNAVIGSMSAEFATVGYLQSNYAKIDLSNLAKTTIGTMLADVGLLTEATIVNGHVTGYLDSVQINANIITAGTLVTDRLVFRGSEKSIVYELNNITGALQAVQSDTLNGEILTDRSITVDKIVAKSITSNEIASGTINTEQLNVSDIFGNSAVLTTLTSQSAFINAISSNSVVVGASNTANSALNAANAAKKQTYHSTAAGAGSSGYFLLAQIVIKGTYQNQPISLSVVNRNGIPSTVWITFANANNTNPGLSKFSKSGSAEFYIVKSATSTWNLYVKKAEAYDNLSVTEFEKGSYMGSTDVTWKSSYVTSLPSGYVTAAQTIATAEWCYNNDVTYINGGKIYTGTVTANAIAAGAITAAKIAAGAVTADKLNVSSLSAITANLGTVTAGIINMTGVTSNSTYISFEDTGGYYNHIGAYGMDLMAERKVTTVHPGYITMQTNDSESAIALARYATDYATDIAPGWGIFSHRLSVGGYNNTSYALSTASFICNSWIRTVGHSGWYNETYGGGWYMSDTTWIRAYNNKGIYTSGTVYAGTIKTTSGANLDTINNKLSNRGYSKTIAQNIPKNTIKTVTVENLNNFKYILARIVSSGGAVPLMIPTELALYDKLEYANSFHSTSGNIISVSIKVVSATQIQVWGTCTGYTFTKIEVFGIY